MARISVFLCLFIFVSSVNGQRPVPNVITGGNPRQRDVPWPTQTTSRTGALYKHLNNSTFYQRAHRQVYYRDYMRHYQSCAAHRRGMYSYSR